MKKLLIFLLVILSMIFISCKSKKSITETEVQTKEVVKTEIKYRDKEIFRDTGSVKTVIKYNTFYDTVTRKLYVYPSVIEKSENKAITATKDKSVVIIQNLEKSLTETLKQRNKEVNSNGALWKAIYWLLVALAVSICINIWFIKIKS